FLQDNVDTSVACAPCCDCVIPVGPKYARDNLFKQVRIDTEPILKSRRQIIANLLDGSIGVSHIELLEDGGRSSDRERFSSWVNWIMLRYCFCYPPPACWAHRERSVFLDVVMTNVQTALEVVVVAKDPEKISSTKNAGPAVRPQV